MQQMIRNACVRLSVGLCVVLAIMACSEQGNVDDRRAAPTPSAARINSDAPIDKISGAAGARLTESELAARSKAALDGDGQAAYSIVMHYESAALDRRNGEYWAHIAAENGDVDGMMSYSSYLMDVADFDQCRRALFWVKRAMQKAEGAKSSYLAKLVIETEGECQKLE